MRRKMLQTPVLGVVCSQQKFANESGAQSLPAEKLLRAANLSAEKSSTQEISSRRER